MKYFTYILLNSKRNKTYVGHTNDLDNRLSEHNSGESKYTSRFGPWQILYTEEYNTEAEAIKREKYYKSAAGRRFINKNLF